MSELGALTLLLYLHLLAIENKIVFYRQLYSFLFHLYHNRYMVHSASNVICVVSVVEHQNKHKNASKSFHYTASMFFMNS